MKKHILLTTTAMLLSAITLKANADSNSAHLNIDALFVKPMELVTENNLKFGMILADEGGKTVIVTPNGDLGETSTATMISKASYKNSYQGSFNEAQIRLKGFLNEDYDGADFFEPNEENMNMVYTATFDNNEVELKSNTESITCGTVTDFTIKYTAEDDDAILHVGGTLTTADLRGQTRSLMCHGSTTVTIVVNEETMKSL